jgi:hypothetical protein
VLDFPLPAWPSRRYGRTPVRLRFLAQVAAAIETEPPARPNWASMAAWLDGIRPCCQVVAVRGLISNGPEPARPNSATRLEAWNAPQT